MAFRSPGDHQAHRIAPLQVQERGHAELVCDAVGLGQADPRYDEGVSVKMHAIAAQDVSSLEVPAFLIAQIAEGVLASLKAALEEQKGCCCISGQSVQHGLCAVIPPTDDQASGLGFHSHRQPGAREGFKLVGNRLITPDSGCNGTCRGCGDEFLDGWMDEGIP